MKEPFQRKSETPMPRRRVKKAGTRRADAGAKKPRRRLPRVRGGKALARLNFFERQRQTGESDVAHKATPAVAVVSAGSTRSMGRRGTRGGAESPYLTAFAEKSHLARTAPAAPVEQAWRPMGPFSIPHGQTYGQGAGSRPPVAGRVVAVAIDPGNADHVLIGAAGGGVWESKDTGKTWQPRTDDQPSLSIGAVVFDPANPLIVYAGTGEGDSQSLLWASDCCDRPTAAPRGRCMRRTVRRGRVLRADRRSARMAIISWRQPRSGSSSRPTAVLRWTRRRAEPTWEHLDASGRQRRYEFDEGSICRVRRRDLFRSTNGGTSWTAVTLPGCASGLQRLEVRHASIRRQHGLCLGRRQSTDSRSRRLDG